jgi:hypothetical protein
MIVMIVMIVMKNVNLKIVKHIHQTNYSLEEIENLNYAHIITILHPFINNSLIIKLVVKIVDYSVDCLISSNITSKKLFE